MCGRYHFGIIDTPKGKQIKEKAEKLNLVYAQGEIFPTNNVLCVIPNESKIDLASMKWGINSKSLLINARVETINDRPTYNAIKNNRCAVICNGFYEWDKDKNKYYIDFDEEYMYLACIFNESNELVILTTSSNSEFSNIHDRMPIIMSQDEMLNYVHQKSDLFVSKNLKIKQVNEDIKLF